MMKIRKCTNCGSDNLFTGVKAKDAYICGDCAAKFKAFPERITVRENGSPESDFRLGMLFWADKRTEEARIYLSAAMEGGIAEAGRLLEILDTAPAAEDTAAERNKKVKSFRRQRDNMLRKGFELIKTDAEKGENLIRLSAEQGNTAAFFKMGCICEERGDIPEAILWYRKATGKEVSANVKLAAIYIRFGQYRMAEELLRAAADRMHVTAIYALGVFYRSQERYAEAREYLEIIETQYPEQVSRQLAEIAREAA